VQVWAAFPPAWVEWLPPTWLARFVEQAAIAPTFATFGIGVGILALGLVSATAAIGQVGRMYARMQPARVNARPRPLPAGQLGGVGGWLTRWLGGPTPEGRVGFWLARNMLKRDGDLAMRCLLPFASPVAVMALALGSGQCGNPLVERDPQRIVLPILVVGLMALAVPPVVYNLTFSRDHAAAWQILAAPLASPGAYGRGAARAAWLATVLPLSLLFVVTASIAWGDPLSALLHGGLAVLMAWPLTLAALALMVPDLPFSRPTVRGGAFAPIALPMVVLGSAVMLVAGGHLVFGGTIGFWLGTVIGCVVVALVMGPRADARMRRLFRGGR
jgi:hypothetical protein